MPLKPWICWKAPPPKEQLKKEEEQDPSRNERLKKLLQFKALQTKCQQRQVSIRQSQQLLRRAAERWRGALEDSRPRLRRAAVGDAKAGPEAEATCVPPAPAPLPRTAEMWRNEAVKLRAALQERRTLNQCLKLEVETLERAFYSLIQLGDQQMADLSAIEERNASLHDQQRDARADCQQQYSSYWESEALHGPASPVSPTSVASVGSCGTLLEEMQLTAAQMHRDLGDLEAQLLQSRRQADLAQQQAVVMAQQHLQAAMKPQSVLSPSARSNFGRLEADFSVDPQDPEEMEALARADVQETGKGDTVPAASFQCLEGSKERMQPSEGTQRPPPDAVLPDAPQSPRNVNKGADDALRCAAGGAGGSVVPGPDARLQHHMTENQHLELHILHYKERLQQRLLKEHIAQHRLKAELQRLRRGGNP